MCAWPVDKGQLITRGEGKYTQPMRGTGHEFDSFTEYYYLVETTGAITQLD